MAQAADVLTAVVAALQTIPELNNLAFQVYSEKELMDKTRHIPPPWTGVLYEGMRSTAEPGKASHLTGLSAEIGIAVVILMKPEIASSTAIKSEPVNLLDLVRRKLRDTVSPAGHTWKFIVEAPALEKDGAVMWIQRWSTPIKLTQGL